MPVIEMLDAIAASGDAASTVCATRAPNVLKSVVRQLGTRNETGNRLALPKQWSPMKSFLHDRNFM